MSAVGDPVITHHAFSTTIRSGSSLVRIPACHAGVAGFESVHSANTPVRYRHRQVVFTSLTPAVFPLHPVFSDFFRMSFSAFFFHLFAMQTRVFFTTGEQFLACALEWNQKHVIQAMSGVFSATINNPSAQEIRHGRNNEEIQSWMLCFTPCQIQPTARQHRFIASGRTSGPADLRQPGAGVMTDLRVLDPVSIAEDAAGRRAHADGQPRHSPAVCHRRRPSP